jgi:hypothetical protein
VGATTASLCQQCIVFYHHQIMGITIVEPTPSDLAIASSATLIPVTSIASQLGLTDDDIDPYGRYKAKVSGQLTSFLV